MGFFSWDCNECGHPLLSPDATNTVNQWMASVVTMDKGGHTLTGTYDGYGRVSGTPIDYDPNTLDACCYHRACWDNAGRPTDYRPSTLSDDQGWFFDDGDHDLGFPGLADSLGQWAP